LVLQKTIKMKKIVLFALLFGAFLTTFAQTQTLTICGGVFTDPAGPDANYAADTDYIVTLLPAIPGQQVTVTFTSFAVEADWDALYVYNGDTTAAPQIASANPAANVPGGLAGGFWGTVNPGPFTSTHPSGALTFRFRSDNIIEQSGWTANVTCTPPPTCPKPTGLIATTVTTNSALLTWTNNSAASLFEVVALPCGITPTAATAGIETSLNPFTVNGLTQGVCYTLYVKAICTGTDESDWSSGVTITTIPTCPPLTQVSVTNLTTNSAVVGWPSTTASTWQVIALPCGSPAPTASTTGWQQTTVNPYVMTGLSSLTCYNFYVRVICSASDSSSWSLPTTATTLAVPPVCGGNFTDPGGPNANYADNTDSTVTICPTIAGEIVTVTFTVFNTEANWDALYVFDGNTISSPQIASTNTAGNVPGGLAGGYWGTVVPGPFTSTDPTGCLTFRFRSDTTINRPGWIANVTCSPPPTCPKPTNLVTTGATINSVVLAWTNNSTASSFEVVALPCGTLPTGSTTGTVTSLNPFTIPNLSPSTCYNLFVRAICSATDASLWSVGLTFTTLSIPPVCGGNFIDNGGNGANYLPNSDSTVTICPTTPGEVVTVTFSSFNVQANSDALYVYDGSTLDAPQIVSPNNGANVPGGVAGGFWGTINPGPFSSTDPSGCLTFRFRSNGTINNGGWLATIACGPATDKIQLIAFVDQNNNGAKESNESLYTNGSFIYQQNNTGPNVNAYSPSGRYILSDANPTNTYDFSYAIQPEFSAYYSAGTTTFNDVSIPVGSGTNNLYFPITLTQAYNDVTVSIVPLGPPRPGLTYTNKVIYKNNGVAASSGTLSFNKPTPVAILSVDQLGTATTTTGFTYTFTNLLPNETRIINVVMTVPSSPTVVINQLLTATASITAPSNDIDLTNNSSTLSQIVVNSYDPNDKMEAHGDKIPFNQFTVNDYLFYTIRFQNLGTANAIDVEIQDILNAKIDETSIRMVSASHHYTMDRLGNNITWNFNDIQLVPASVSPELSMGFISFKVKLKPGFAVGDIIPNTASIFFDSNPAIVTNTFNTKFIAALNTQSYELETLIMYPNPAYENVTFSMTDTNENIQTISFTDVLGKTIKTIKNSASNEVSVGVSDLSAGIYFVEVTTISNLKTTKKLIVK
jgi:uncharacterized repeat protein (TIGR01451 family)